VCVGIISYGLHAAHIRTTCSICDVTHMIKITKPFPACPYCKQQKPGWVQGMMLSSECV